MENDWLAILGCGALLFAGRGLSAKTVVALPSEQRTQLISAFNRVRFLGLLPLAVLLVASFVFRSQLGSTFQVVPIFIVLLIWIGFVGLKGYRRLLKDFAEPTARKYTLAWALQMVGLLLLCSYFAGTVQA